MSTAMIKQRLRRLAGGKGYGLAALLVLGALAGSASPARAAGTVHGCQSGYVCIYPQNAGWNGDRPSLRFYTYGPHNLSNQFGTHRMLNNQTGGAWVVLCAGYNGTGSGLGILGTSYSYDFNLTPVNSIELTRGMAFSC